MRSGRKFCVVLLDMRMPVMSGVEFRREQMRDPKIAGVEVVAFSAASDERVEAAKLGIHFSIAKPVQLVHLLDSVAERCGRRTAGWEERPRWAVCFR